MCSNNNQVFIGESREPLISKYLYDFIECSYSSRWMGLFRLFIFQKLKKDDNSISLDDANSDQQI